jgi:hypothetical protein
MWDRPRGFRVGRPEEPLNQIVDGDVEMVVWSLAIEAMYENWKSVGA